MIDVAAQQQAQGLLKFIDDSPSPWHAVASMTTRLEEAGFHRLYESDSWSLQTQQRYYVIRDDSSIIAFTTGQGPVSEQGFSMIGAHTDSPGFRVKPNAESSSGGYQRLGVEIYGGPILATFTDRDLSVAGRVSYQTNAGPHSQLVHFPQPLLRLPNLAIHMNRGVNEEGLKLHKQKELPLLLSVSPDSSPEHSAFVRLLADQLEVDPKQILAWDLAVCDTQPGAVFGMQQEFIANSQLDNLASCHAALTALLSDPGQPTGFNVCACFDHEEIGSLSNQGADGSFLGDVLQRICDGLEPGQEAFKRACVQSFLISADMAHAYQPNFPEAYEPDHHVLVNKGPVIKRNANQRYASDSASEAHFIACCERAGVPFQRYTHRNEIPCGGTIGPMTSARLGIPTVDVGNPMWAMHSLRESAGVLDHSYMTQVMQQFYFPATS